MHLKFSTPKVAETISNAEKHLSSFHVKPLKSSRKVDDVGHLKWHKLLFATIKFCKSFFQNVVLFDKLYSFQPDLNKFSWPKSENMSLLWCFGLNCKSKEFLFLLFLFRKRVPPQNFWFQKVLQLVVKAFKHLTWRTRLTNTYQLVWTDSAAIVFPVTFPNTFLPGFIPRKHLLVSKSFWRRLLDISWRRLEHVL